MKICITGASAGIGLETARYFLKQNHEVIAVARRGEPLRALAQEFPGKVLSLPLDLQDRDRVLEAFAKLPAGTVEALLKDIPKLTKILTYHVVSGKVMAADVVKLKSAKTVEGSEVKIDASNGVKINDSTVTTADVAADNGVIHIIDSVLLPA